MIVAIVIVTICVTVLIGVVSRGLWFRKACECTPWQPGGWKVGDGVPEPPPNVFYDAWWREICSKCKGVKKEEES